MNARIRLDTLWSQPMRRRSDVRDLVLTGDFPAPLGKVRASGVAGAELEKLLARCHGAAIRSCAQARRHGGYWILDRTLSRAGDERVLPVLRWVRHRPLEERVW